MFFMARLMFLNKSPYKSYEFIGKQSLNIYFSRYIGEDECFNSIKDVQCRANSGHWKIIFVTMTSKSDTLVRKTLGEITDVSLIRKKFGFDVYSS